MLGQPSRRQAACGGAYVHPLLNQSLWCSIVRRCLESPSGIVKFGRYTTQRAEDLYQRFMLLMASFSSALLLLSYIYLALPAMPKQLTEVHGACSQYSKYLPRSRTAFCA